MKSTMLALVVLAMCLSRPDGGKMFPRGIYLNNPGNIELADDHWVGMAKLQTDDRFIRFLSPVYGLRAMMKVLITYGRKHELTTISEVITRWAPPRENNTDAYIAHVAKRMKISPNQAIDLEDLDTLIRLAKAITMHENGYPPEELPADWYSEATYHQAAIMALGKRND
jgi:hypothetical protein